MNEIRSKQAAMQALLNDSSPCVPGFTEEDSMLLWDMDED